MPDKRSLLLLKLLCGICVNSGYKVIELQELAAGLPPEYAFTSADVDKMLAFLNDRSFISLRYGDGNEACLCVLPKGREACEREIERETSERECKLEEEREKQPTDERGRRLTSDITCSVIGAKGDGGEGDEKYYAENVRYGIHFSHWFFPLLYAFLGALCGGVLSQLLLRWLDA